MESNGAELYKKSHRRCSIKKAILKKTHALESLFNKVAGFQGLQLYEKETPTQFFFSECCYIIKNTYFEEHLLMANHLNEVRHLCIQ